MSVSGIPSLVSSFLVSTLPHKFQRSDIPKLLSLFAQLREIATHHPPPFTVVWTWPPRAGGQGEPKVHLCFPLRWRPQPSAACGLIPETSGFVH